ncbi:MAG: ABC transporter substrate-binding protein [Campylobacteraceae bacterium]|nr:ABC transporter substrate-binding protein [Campylobacteraceae bacterium]
MINKKVLPFIFVVFILLFSLTNSFAAPLKKVSLQLMWLDQFEFAGFYVAKEKGFYQEFGLDVKIKKFTSSTNILNTVLEDEAQFGISSSSLLIENSLGKDVLLLGAIFQSSPLVLLALKDSGINTLEDIKGKKVMISKEEAFFVTLQTMLKSKNINISDLQILEHSFNVDDLINKKTDLLLAYSTNQPFTLQEKGYESKIFHPKDYGFDFYEDLIFTTNKFQKQNPQVVHDFYTASIKGWEYALNNIDEVAQLVFEKYNSQNKSLEALIFEANEIKKLALMNGVKFGTITQEKLKLIENSYKIMGLLKNDLDISKLLYTPNKNSSLSLSSKELAYLKQKKVLRYCIDPNWFPYESIENSQHMGMSADLIQIIQTKLDIPLQLVQTIDWLQSLEYVQNRTCDILPLAKNIPSRRSFLNFTKPFFSFPVVVATQATQLYVPKVKNILHKKLGVVKGYSLNKILKEKYPNINIVQVDSIKDGLQRVLRGELYGLIDSLITIGYEIQNNFISELKISSQFDMNHPLSVASRSDEPLLHSILEKTLNGITEKTKQSLINSWISIKVEKSVDYSMLWQFLILVFLIISAFVYRHYVLTKSTRMLERKIEIKTKELQVLNDNLEKTGKRRTEELEDSNEVFQHMLQTTMEAIFILEYDYCVDANKEALNLFQYHSNEELVGTYLFDFIDKNSHEYLASNENLSEDSSYEVKAIKRDGTVFPALMKLHSLQTKNRIIKILTLLDLTKMKEQELKLINQSKMSSLGELIGNIAHQWRQPLASITTAASGMKMQKELGILSDDDIYSNCDDIVESSNYLSETINDFKNLIKRRKNKKDFKINETLKKGLKLLSGQFKTHLVDIIEEYDQEITLNGYGNDLTQVIVNILKNSNDAFIENNEESEKLIFLTTLKKEKNILICIKDNAGGIPENILDKIFEPYFTTKHKAQGTGLGLYMTHQIIIDSFQGSIEVCNANYQYNNVSYTGAQFTISLPII